MAERVPAATLPPPLPSLPPPPLLHACCATCHKSVWIGPGAQDFESTVAQGFVKHGFKVLLHRVVDGPLQASRCLVFIALHAFIPGIPVHFGLKVYRVGFPSKRSSLLIDLQGRV